MTVWVIHSLLAGVVVCFARSLAIFYGTGDKNLAKAGNKIGPGVRRRRQDWAAIRKLEINHSDLGKPIRLMLINHLSKAYNYLTLANADLRIVFSDGLKWFGYGLGLLLTAMLGYLFLSISHKALP